MPQHTWEKLARLLQSYLKMPYPLKPGIRFEIQQINNLPAATSPFGVHLLKTGFEKDGAKLVLWPSSI
jgi:hypothetical protein